MSMSIPSLPSNGVSRDPSHEKILWQSKSNVQQPRQTISGFTTVQNEETQIANFKHDRICEARRHSMTNQEKDDSRSRKRTRESADNYSDERQTANHGVKLTSNSENPAFESSNHNEEILWSSNCKAFLNDTSNGITDGDLLHAVRLYCSQLPDSGMMEPHTTHEYMQDIERLSGGYKLISSYQHQQQDQERRTVEHPCEPSDHKNDDENRQLALTENRQRVLQQLIPALEQMEQQKKIKEAEHISELTNCRADKVRVKPKGTGYVYYDIQTGDEVPCDEYQRRYMNSVALKKRCQGADDALGALSEEDEVENIVTASQRPVDKVKAEREVEKRSEAKILFRTPSPEARSDISEVTITPAIEPSRGVMHSATFGDDTEEIFSNNGERRTVNRSGEGEPSLFPVRGEKSSDPLIAVAQERLWKILDVALSEYSAEVIRIYRVRTEERTMVET